MKVKDVMTRNPVCCRATNTVQEVARLLKDKDIGSVLVVSDDSQRLEGIVTDRDLCCGVLPNGLDAKTTTIEKLITRKVASCHPDDNLEACLKSMQERQVRRAPVIDSQGRCVGIVAQADLALKLGDQPKRFHETVAAISRPASSHRPRAVA